MPCLNDLSIPGRSTTFARGTNAAVAFGLALALLSSSSLLLAENPRTPQDSAREGAEALKGRRYDEAIRCFSETLSVRPDDVPALLGRAEAYRESGDLQRSLTDYSEVVRLAPTNAEAYRGRSRTHDKNRNLKASIADLNETIRLDPKDRESLWFRSQYYVHFNLHDAALADLDAAIAIDLLDPLPHLWRAKYYEDRDMWSAAETDYIYIQLLDPELLRKVSYSTSGALLKAIADITQDTRPAARNPRSDAGGGRHLQSRGKL
jgi:tetratricopeptide (TPR) repeat protein